MGVQPVPASIRLPGFIEGDGAHLAKLLGKQAGSVLAYFWILDLQHRRRRRPRQCHRHHAAPDAGCGGAGDERHQDDRGNWLSWRQLQQEHGFCLVMSAATAPVPGAPTGCAFQGVHMLERCAVGEPKWRRCAWCS